MSFSIAFIAIVCFSMATAVVHELTDDNFDVSIADGNTWFVKFFAPWCGHCKRLAPIWEELGDEDVSANIARVDCTVHKAACQAQGIRGYPTLKLFSNGASGGEKYQGPRSLDALKTFITSKDEL